MSITVTANPTSSPPRFEISISSNDGTAIETTSMIRTADGQTVSTRVQPTPGPSPIHVNDYEAPWGVPVQYIVAITHNGTTETLTSPLVTLSPAFPWAIHPTTPALSVCIDQGRFNAMGLVSIGSETRPALTTKHRILGSEYQVVTKTGPRGAVQTSIQIATVTSQERAALTAVTRDQTPLLIQFPPAWGWDWENGYYDVGDVTTDRFMQYGPEPRRTFGLQLERVDAPAGGQQAERTWTDVLSGFATWADVAAAYQTWTDVLTDSRR